MPGAAKAHKPPVWASGALCVRGYLPKGDRNPSYGSKVSLSWRSRSNGEGKRPREEAWEHRHWGERQRHAFGDYGG